MARKLDSGWRDTLLAKRHDYYGFGCPTAGMTLPMIEYDRGEPLAVINYIRRGDPMPKGPDVGAAYEAMGALRRADGCSLPFFTAKYDPFNWAMKLFPHNDAARTFLLDETWRPMSETEFVSHLYRLRGRKVPDLSPYGVAWDKTPWSQFVRASSVRTAEQWPGQLMSERRRNYEPVGQVRAALRNPCVDIDLAVVDRDRQIGMVVDYKAPGARVSITSTNIEALSGLHVGSGFSARNVPAFVVRYAPVKPAWTFKVHCANANARQLLSFALGHSDARSEALADAIGGADWVDLTEAEWLDVMRTARDL